jgi:hypothetical protein
LSTSVVSVGRESKRCSGFLYQGVVMIELSGRVIYLL